MNADDPVISDSAEVQISEGGSPKSTAAFRLLTVAGFAAAFAVYALRLDQVVGLTIDDGWYVLLARALAEGAGYTVINSPSPGILPLYPPGFPFLLSILYRLSPHFPDNLWLLKSVSIVSMMVSGWLTIVYLRRFRNESPLTALGIALAFMLCVPLAFLATSTVMSECFFTLLLISTILLVETAAREFANDGRRAWILLAAGALVSSYSFLTRSIAVALIGAAFLYLLKHRLIRQAIVFAAIVAVTAGPWVIYSRINAPTPEQQFEQGGHIIQPYADQFWQRVASIEEADRITLAELPSRVWNNLLEVAGFDALHITAAPVFESLRDPIAEARRLSAEGFTDKTEGTIPVSYLISLIMIVGYVSAVRKRIGLAEIAVPMLIAVTVLWPWETIRFLLPLTPLLFYYLVRGTSVIGGLLGRIGLKNAAGISAGVAIVLILIVNLYGHQSYLSRKLSDSALEKPVWLQAFLDAEDVMNWVDRSLPKDKPVVTLNPPLVYLYTGRRTVAWSRPADRWELWKSLGIRHFVRFSAYPLLPEPQLQKFQTVYRPGNPYDYRVIDFGPPDRRDNWQAADD